MDEFNSNNAARNWLAVGCAATVVLTICCVAGIMGGLIWIGSQSADGLAQVNINAPSTVEQGGTFVIAVEITNISGKTIQLNSVDISKNLLHGFIIGAVEPAYIETYEYGGLNEEYQTFAFNIAIPPGESLTVHFESEAVLPGDFSGEIDVCVNTAYNCHRSALRAIVK